MKGQSHLAHVQENNQYRFFFMKGKIDIAVVLRTIARIQTKGTSAGDQKLEYRGLELESDFDGYTVVLRNKDVTLTVLFHNKYDLKFRNRPALDDFYETVTKIARESSAERSRQP